MIGVAGSGTRGCGVCEHDIGCRVRGKSGKVLDFMRWLRQGAKYLVLDSVNLLYLEHVPLLIILISYMYYSQGMGRLS